MKKPQNPPRQLPPKRTPFEGLSNTQKRVDTGAPHDLTEQKMDKNSVLFGVQSRAREFQPFFRFQGSDRGSTVTAHDDHAVITKNVNIGQPQSLAYRMESQGCKTGCIQRAGKAGRK